jgi:pyruvate/2-oxoglutarate dehydrogenase complex dihydrolipoamide dehydrogenase (E3) component
MLQSPHPVGVSSAKHTFDYDLAIIGGGSGGYSAARTAVNAGLKVAVIEGGEEVGGLCILRGCMPTKSLLYAAEVMHLASHAEPWGIRAENVSFNFAGVMARKNLLVKGFADYRHDQLRNGKFEFIRATARFADAHTLELLPLPIGWGEGRGQGDVGDSKTVRTVTAAHFIIATGSTIAPSPISCIDPTTCLNSDTALKLTRLPKSMIILGGGATACEFAQFFQRFGVKVTLIQRGSHVLHDFDSDAATELEKVFRREGMTIYTGTKVTDSRSIGSQKEVIFEQDGKTLRVSAEDVFFALGRIPNTAPLGLEKIGVTLDEHRVMTNHRMQTNLDHIYAVGDCTSQHEIVHIAVQQGEVAGHNVAHPERVREMDYRLLTEIVFTDPQVAAVGLTERKARERDIAYVAASYPFPDHGKSLIMDAKGGFVKLLANPTTGELLGGCCVGPLGGELIHEIIAAMHKRMTAHELAAMPHYHPTLAEIWTYPAEELAEKILLK